MINYFKNIWQGIFTVLIGMRITMYHLFVKKVTAQYPEKIPDKKALMKADLMPEISRNRIFVDMGICNGCNSCVRACPVNCITVETQKVTPGDTIPPLTDGTKRGLWVTDFKIDFAKCCFCSLCTLDCPTEAIKMTPEFEYSSFDRKDMIYTFSTMTPEVAKEKKELYDNYMEEKKKADAAKKVAEAAAAASKTD